MTTSGPESTVRIRAEGAALDKLRVALPVGSIVKAIVLEELSDGRVRVEINGRKLTAEGFPATKAQGVVELRVCAHVPRILLRPVPVGPAALVERLAASGVPPTQENLRLLAAVLAQGGEASPETIHRLAGEMAQSKIPPEALAYFHSQGLPRDRETTARLARSGPGEIARAFESVEPAREIREAAEGRALVAAHATAVLVYEREGRLQEAQIQTTRAENGATRIHLRLPTAEGEIRAALDFSGKEIGASFRFPTPESAARRRGSRSELGTSLAARGFRLGAFSVDADRPGEAGAPAVGLDLKV